MLNDHISFWGNCVDQLMCEICPPLEDVCDMFNGSEVSDDVENIDQINRSNPFSITSSECSTLGFAHRDNHVLEISLKLDNVLLNSELACSKSSRGIDLALFTYNVLFEDDINTPNKPSGENYGLACL